MMKKFIPNLEVIESIGTKEQRDKWCESLRSGKYKQHRGEMVDPNDLSCACCLQVAAVEIDGIKPKDSLYLDLNNRFRSYPTPSFSDKTTFSTTAITPNVVVLDDGVDYCKSGLTFSQLNDSYLTHEQIADIIEGKKVYI